MVSPRNALESLSARAAAMIPPPDATAQRSQTEVAANQRLQTEEAAKQSLVLPFIQALGYDIFDHDEVVPEFTADFGGRQGGKVDYAIMRDGKPIIIFECKKAGDPLDATKESQLERYFAATREASIGVLTGGLRYKFYSDLVAPNVMDREPFLEFDIRTLDSQTFAALERFTKGQFNVDDVKDTATKMLYITGAKEYLGRMHNQPNEDFVRAIASGVGYPPEGERWTTTRMEYFTGLAREAFQGFVADRINATLTDAMARQRTVDVVAPEAEETEASGEDDRAGDIVTTVEEQEAYEMVRTIVSNVVAPERVMIQDTQQYSAVVIDGNSRQTICRFRFGPRVKSLCFGPVPQEEKNRLESLANIADYADRLRESAASHLQR